MTDCNLMFEYICAIIKSTIISEDHLKNERKKGKKIPFFHAKVLKLT